MQPIVVLADGRTIVDGFCHGLDIKPFIECIFVGDIESAACSFCADVNLDGSITVDDIPCFVMKLVSCGTATCDEGPCAAGGPSPRSSDCNENAIQDANDAK